MHKWEDNDICRGSPQGARGLCLTLGAPSLGVLHRKDKPLKHLALKASGTWVEESWRAVKIEIPLLKGMHRISQTPSSSIEAVIWKDPGGDPLSDFWRTSQRQEATRPPPGDIDASKHHFGVTPLAYDCQKLICSPGSGTNLCSLGPAAMCWGLALLTSRSAPVPGPTGPQRCTCVETQLCAPADLLPPHKAGPGSQPVQPQ